MFVVGSSGGDALEAGIDETRAFLVVDGNPLRRPRSLQESSFSCNKGTE